MNEFELFQSALDIEDPAARRLFLQSRCENNAELLKRVEALLASHQDQSQFLNTPVVEQIADVSDAATAGTILFGTGSTEEKEVQAPPGFVHMTQQNDDSDDEIPLGYLEPSSKPGSLGRLAHYEVLEVIGRGAFGTVLRALDEKLQRVVAIKVMAPELACTSPARKRFLREAQASAAIRHEHVVSIYAVEEKPLPYLVMEYIPGETLQQRLDARGPLDVLSVLQLGRQIAEGLAAAHAKDLIHRDVKPGNILLETGVHDKVKITDFGLARAADDASLTQSGTIAGTPMYMAPEQALGDKLDLRADLFSFGSVLYQMVSGRPPFRAPSALAVLKRVAEETPRPIREIIPETPDWLCGIIAKLHAKNPDDRFQSAQEVADLFADCEAKLKAKQEIVNVLPGVKPTGWKWTVAAAVLLLPMIALALTEFAGVTHLFQKEQPTVAIAPKIDPKVTPTTDPEAEPKAPLPPAYTNSIGMEFVIVPKGKSWLGGGKDKLGDQEVEIPADFYLGKYEVTQEEWEKVMGENPSQFSRTRNKGKVNDVTDADLQRFPVEDVSWDQCQLFVAKLNQQAKGTGWVYRLPTEAEWEYACRGGPMADKADSAFDYYFARPTNTLLPQQANFAVGKPLNRTCKVGSYEGNRLGVFDLHGNVMEWCQDSFVNPSDGALHRMHIGGSWHADSELALRAARIVAGDPSRSAPYLGLRLARVPAGALSPAAKTPPLAVGPFTDAEVQRIAALPAAEQVEEVRKELMRRNPGFDGKVTHKIANGVVTELRINADKVTDISPIRVFNALRSLRCSGTPYQRENGQLSDLTPLKGMKLEGLTRLDLGWTKVGDAGLAYFKGCTRLTHLHLDRTPVTDAGLDHFKDCKDLTNLSLELTQVSDAGVAQFRDCKNLTSLRLPWTKVTNTGLDHFKDCKNLTSLWLSGTKVSDAGLAYFKDHKNLNRLDLQLTKVSDAGLAYFKDCKNLAELNLAQTEVSDAGLAYFKDCKNLAILGLHNTHVSDTGLAYFNDCKNLTSLRIERTKITDLSLLKEMPLKELTCDFQPERDAAILRSINTLETINGKPAAEFWKEVDEKQAWLKRIAALPAAGQVEEVRKELMRRNPGFGGTLTPKITDGVVTGLRFLSDEVENIAPVRALSGLTSLDCSSSGKGKAKLSDLSPLKGMQLISLTVRNCSEVRDLSPLKDMPLTVLNVGYTGIQDIEPLQGMLLTSLHIDATKVLDLKLIKGFPLTLLDLGSTQVRDLNPLRGIPLTYLNVGSCRQLRDLEPLQNMPLDYLNINSTKVRDLMPLKSMPLKSLQIQFTDVTDLSPLKDMQLNDIRLTLKNITQGLDILREMKSLTSIGIHWEHGKSWPTAEFWERYDKGEFASPAPLTDANI